MNDYLMALMIDWTNQLSRVKMAIHNVENADKLCFSTSSYENEVTKKLFSARLKWEVEILSNLESLLHQFSADVYRETGKIRHSATEVLNHTLPYETTTNVEDENGDIEF